MPREAKVGGGVWHEYILLLKKCTNTTSTTSSSTNKLGDQCIIYLFIFSFVVLDKRMVLDK